MTALATTLTNLINETSNLLGDPSGTRWSQTVSATPNSVSNPIQAYLIEAQEEFNRLSGIYRTSVSVPVISGTPTAIVTDANGNPPFGSILRIEDQTGKALIRTTSSALDTLIVSWKGSASSATVQGQPDRWVRGLDGFGTIRLYPCPNVTATFTAYIVARPQMMTNGNNYPFTNSSALTADNPAHYHYALPYYAAYKALTWNKDSADMPMAKFYLEQFQRIVQQAAEEVKASMEA